MTTALSIETGLLFEGESESLLRKHDSDDDDVMDKETIDDDEGIQLDQTGRTGKKKLYKADLEGPAFNLVKAFHKNNVFLQFQMDECHQVTDEIRTTRSVWDVDKSHGKAGGSHGQRLSFCSKYNKGMEIGNRQRVTEEEQRRLTAEFEKRLQIRRIFRSRKSFVGGRIRDIDYRLINRTT
ncbi:hypothetical protein Tco_0304609 [Tanacetum coccineum]